MLWTFFKHPRDSWCLPCNWRECSSLLWTEGGHSPSVLKTELLFTSNTVQCKSHTHTHTHTMGEDRFFGNQHKVRSKEFKQTFEQASTWCSWAGLKKKSQGVHIPATKSKGKTIKRLTETQEFFNASTINSNQGVGCFGSYDHMSHLFSQKQGSYPAFCVQFV